MKKINLLFLLLISFNFLFSQKKERLDINVKITEKKEIETSSVKIFYHFSGKTFDSLFYKKISKFYLNIEVNSIFYKKQQIKHPSGSITLNGIEPGSIILVKSFCDCLDGDYLVLDTLIKTNKIRFIKLKNPRKVSFEKKDVLEEDCYLITNGAKVDNKGNFIGAYTVNSFLENKIKEEKKSIWYKKNGIIGFCDGIPLFFSGFDKYENEVSYYNSGLFIRDNIVVFKRGKKIFNVNWLLQSEPILINDKQNNCNSNKCKIEEKPRSAIGFDSSHNIFYIISPEPITLFDFSEELLKKRVDGALLLEGAGYKDKYGEYGKLKKKNMNIIYK